MQIVLVTHYYAPESGAAAVRLTRLTRMLAARGHGVTVVAPLPHYPDGVVPENFRGRFVRKYEEQGVQCVRLWLWTHSNATIVKRLISQVSFFLTCSAYLLFQKRPDVVLVENQPIFTGLAGWLFSRVKNAPYVINVSDFWPEVLLTSDVLQETSLLYRLYKMMVNLTQQQADTIIAMYPAIATSIQQRIQHSPPIEIILNAVDLQKFHPQVRAADFLSTFDILAGKIVLFVGVIGSHLDLESMLTVAQHLPDVTFLYVGMGSQDHKLQRAIDTGLNNIHWIKWVDFKWMPMVWTCTTVVFWALHDRGYEAQRVQAKLFEALASGTPLVVATQGDMANMIQAAGAGIVPEIGNVNEMVEGVHKLLADDDFYSACSHAARNYAEQHFDIQNVTTRYEAVLQASVDKTRA